METKKTYLTPEQIKSIIEKHPEIALQVITDYEAFKLINKKFVPNELKQIIALQIQGKILETLRNNNK